MTTPDRDHVAALAVADQHSAALRDELAGRLDVLAFLSASRYPRRPSRAVLQRYAAELLHRGLRTCEHIGPDISGPAWAAVDDLTLRCAGCLSAHLRRPGPLPPGCDLCNEEVELRAVAVVAAPVPVRTSDGQPCRTPAVVVLAGVCSSCWRAPARSAA